MELLGLRLVAPGQKVHPGYTLPLPIVARYVQVRQIKQGRPEGLYQAVDLHRLEQAPGGAATHNFVPFGFTGVTSEHHHWEVRLELSDDPKSIGAIQPGHADVHEDGIVFAAHHLEHGLNPILRRVGAPACPGQHGLQESQDGRLIIDYQSIRHGVLHGVCLVAAVPPEQPGFLAER